jgi:mannosyltransferase OCH1-like enzyme
MIQELLPYSINPRPDILLKNKFSIIPHSYPDDFNIIIYYLSETNAQIHIYRLDNDEGWSMELKIKIFSIVSPTLFEVVSLGPSNTNSKSMNIEMLSISLYPFENVESEIPKIIMQTNDKEHYENIQHYNAIQSLLKLNPMYQYIYFDGKGRREFIQENMDLLTLETYDKIISKTFKSDFFRYIYLYVKGGCYFDHKFLLKKSLDKIIPKNVSNVLCWDIGHCQLQNGIMMTKPLEPFLYKMIQKIIENVNHLYFGNNVLEPTGPGLLYQYGNKENIYLRFERASLSKNYLEETIVIDSTKEIIGHRYYNQYYQKRHYESYCNIWGQKQMYSKTIQHIDIYTIVVIPSSYEIVEAIQPRKIYKTKKVRHYHANLKRHLGWKLYPDMFRFEFENDTLIIHRIDQEMGWGEPLKIILINNETHKSQEFWIGTSDNNIKKVNLL